MSLDDHIRALIAQAVADAAESASASKEVMNAEEARAFLGLTKDEFKKRRHRVPHRVESERKRYYLRDELLDYLRSLPPGVTMHTSCDYPPDYLPHHRAPYGTEQDRIGA